MILVVKDGSHEVVAVEGIEKFDLVDAEDFMQPFEVIDDIEWAIAELAMKRLERLNKMFKVGDRVMCYSNKGKMGKGTVIPSTDPRLANYIKVRMDRGGLEAAFRADLCKRLVPKVRENDVHSDG
jgi:hypothetical protein